MRDLRSKEYPDPPVEGQQRRGLRGITRDILEISLISFVLFLSINLLSARIRVESVSMEPTLFAGNFVVVSKLAYQFAEPSRGDIIVFHYPPNPEQDPYIKRVIGLPGDQVEVREEEVLINGVRIAEPYLSTPTRQGGTWTVPPDSLFVMGDNRNNSSDSRAWGGGASGKCDRQSPGSLLAPRQMGSSQQRLCGGCRTLVSFPVQNTTLMLQAASSPPSLSRTGSGRMAT